MPIPLNSNPISLYDQMVRLHAYTLWCAKENVDCAGAMHFVLLGDDYGKGCASPAHVLQSLGQRYLCVEEDEVHNHTQISHLPSHHFCILPSRSD